MESTEPQAEHVDATSKGAILGAATIERSVAWVFFASTGVFVALAALVAATLPWSGWDPYFYNQWSRLIAAHGGFHFSEVGAVNLHRPLFYVLEGEIWRLFGYHMALGRFLSLFFTVLLLVAVAWLAARPDRRLLRAAVAVLVTALITPVALHSSDGLTDVPTAATVALAALVLWTVDDSRKRLVLLAVAALLAVLTKPSGVVGIAALLVAQAVGPRVSLRRRLKRDVAPLGLGLVLGIGYDWTQARHVGMSLMSFVQAGVGRGYWAQKSAAARPDAVYGWRWLGEPLHVVLAFAIAYALLRVAGLRHRPAALAGLVAGWAWAWVGPSLADHPFHVALDSTGIATYVVAASLALVVLAPDSVVPQRLHLARLLIWAAPAIAVWAEYAAYDTRLLSAAWPPLALLIAAVLTMTIVAATNTRWPVVAAIPAAAILVLAVNNVYNINGLGRDGWREYRAAGLSGLANHRLMENIALGQFQQELDALRAQVGPNDKIIGADGRLGFFFLGRVNSFPTSCGALQGYRAFVVLLGDDSVAQAREAHAPATEGEWAACRSPSLSLVADLPGNFAVFTIGKPRAPANPDACGVPPPPTGLVAVFGSASSEGAAQAIQRHVAKVGFVQTQVLQTGCAQFSVLETGVPDEKVGSDIVAEARSVDLHVLIRRFP